MTQPTIAAATRRYEVHRSTIHRRINDGTLKCEKKRLKGREVSLLSITELDALYGEPQAADPIPLTETEAPPPTKPPPAPPAETFTDVRTIYQDLIAELKEAHAREITAKDAHIQSLENQNQTLESALKANQETLKEAQASNSRAQQSLMAEQSKQLTASAARHPAPIDATPTAEADTTPAKKASRTKTGKRKKGKAGTQKKPLTKTEEVGATVPFVKALPNSQDKPLKWWKKFFQATP